MKLQIKKRSGLKKSEVLKFRREGFIPAVLYQKGKEGEMITVQGSEYNALVRQVQPGRLSTQQFSLVGEDGVEVKAILKEVQYHPTTYDVLHLDFEELKPDTVVSVKVPIECTGVVDCVGVKLGGVVRQVIRYVKVRCLPKNIPSVFQVDVKDLSINQSRRLNDLTTTDGTKITEHNELRPVGNLNLVAVGIVKR